MRQQTDALAATAHDGTDEPGRRVSSTAPVMKEACDTVISQVEQRFSQSDHLIAAQLVDSSFFPQHVLSFPTPELDCAVKLWPALGNKEKLKSELTTLYRHSELHTGNTALSLLKSIHLIQQLQDFIPKVIDTFCQRKDRRAAFLFK
ncbi:hypothetical protein JOQ06_018306 [Pogonophryne albipinna]|uniref:Uncharacterized protein n=1 Tax=Pogonophryne albipinna TaxID=1090488 RepID=A0AAD6AHN6_9TELE|nr:hypothetical protein JOQ06_018306 [Pogonophryne albipinna]